MISGASVWRSLLFNNVRVNSYANIELAVMLPDVEVGRSVKMRNVIIDRGVKIPSNLVVGDNPDLDAMRFRRTAGGVCLITQQMIDRLDQ